MIQSCEKPTIVIEAQPSSKSYFRELYRCRELCYFFAWRDLKVRYKQAAFGLGWAIIRPLFTMFFFTLIFGYVAKLPSYEVNYPLFVLIGMMVWQLVSSVVLESAYTLINNSSLITKIYFPRMTIPLSLIGVNLIDFAICYSLFFLAVWYTGTSLSWLIIFSPLFILQAILLSIGLSLWCSALTVRYRDFRFVVQLAVQFGLFISPVGYAGSIIPDPWNWVYPLNPVVGIINGLRWATFGIPGTDLAYSVILSFLVTILLIATDYRYFRSVERTMADII